MDKAKRLKEFLRRTWHDGRRFGNGSINTDVHHWIHDHRIVKEIDAILEEPTVKVAGEQLDPKDFQKSINKFKPKFPEDRVERGEKSKSMVKNHFNFELKSKPKPIDHVMVDNLDALLTILGISLKTQHVDAIIDAVELLEDTQGKPTPQQIAKLKSDIEMS